MMCLHGRLIRSLIPIVGRFSFVKNNLMAKVEYGG